MNQKKGMEVNSDMLAKVSLDMAAALPLEKVLQRIDSSENGLNQYEAEKRFATFGPNSIIIKKQKNPVLQLLSNFLNPLVLILLFAAGVSYFLGNHIDAIIIGVIIIISVLLDFIQEYRADKAAEKLKERITTTATVLRDGEKKEIKFERLVTGDIIFLSAGDFVPADARILEAKDFFVNQAALTGESSPSEKDANKLREGTYSLTSLSNIVFRGTNVISGTATAVIIRIGKETEFGKIAKSISGPSSNNEFEIGIKSFGYLIIKATIILVLFILLVGGLVEKNFLEAFLFAMAIAVGLTPELLPAIVSITMAKGSIGMGKKGAIVKKLSSIPTFGSMDVLCTDKTGTLTEDNIKLIKYIGISGKENKEVLQEAFINSCFQTGIKNPLDNAIMKFGSNLTLDGNKKIDEIPFDFIRKRIGIVVQKKNERYLIAKGAPEEIFSISTSCRFNEKTIAFNSSAREVAKKQYHELSKQGYRVIAIATKKVKEKEAYTKKDEEEMTLIGFLGFFDPPKKDVKSILTKLENSGIEVKIITGDNELVTKKICDDIGVNIKGIMIGRELQEITDDALKRRVEKTTIFAQFTPQQKNRVINALRSNGHVVGYLGDGINDAPSLKTADIGLSVNNAVDVAKEASDIILTHKNLAVLLDGVIEGRKAFGNTMKYLLMALSSNFGNMFSMAGAIAFLPFLPMLPVQILLNNLLYDVSQITIPTDNVDVEYTEKPKKWNQQFVKKFMLIFGPVSSLFDFATFFVLYSIFKTTPAVFQTGWFLESLTTQTLVIYFIRTKSVPFFKSKPSKSLTLNTLACVAFGWLLVYLPFGKFFGFQPLPLAAIIAIISIVVVYLVLVEIIKVYFYKKNDF